MLTREPIAAPSLPTDAREGLQRVLVSPSRAAPDELAAVASPARAAPRPLDLAAAPGRERLEVPVARAVALAGRAVVVEHHVPELGAGSDEPRSGLPSRISPPPTPVPRVSMTMSSVPLPAPSFHSAIAADVRRRCRARPGSRTVPLHASRKSKSASGTLHRADERGRSRWSIVDGMPKPIAATPSPRELLDDRVERPPSSSSCETRSGSGARPGRAICPVAVDHPGRGSSCRRRRRR